MGMIGKIIGGTIGFALGGPLGAVAGAVFGHVFDQDHPVSHHRLEQDTLSSMEKTQLAFFVSTFSMLAKLAGIKDQLNQKVLDTIESFAERDLGLSPQAKEVAFQLFHAALNSPAQFDEFCLQFHQHFQHRPELLELMIDILMRVARRSEDCCQTWDGRVKVVWIFERHSGCIWR